jgi:PAS domain S-box-containing protein
MNDNGDLVEANRRLREEIFERNRTEQALRASEEYFRQWAEHVQQVFWIRDLATGRMIYVSPAYEEIWGCRRALLYEKPQSFMNAVHEDDRERILAAVARQNGDSVWFNEEYRIVRPDGSVRWVRARNFPIRDEAGQVYRVAGVADDITELKHAEQQRLADAAAQRDALVREVHHRIKNHLQGLVGLLRQHGMQHPEIAGAMQAAIGQVNAVAIVHGMHGEIVQGELVLCEIVANIVQAAASLAHSNLPPVMTNSMARPVRVAQDEAVPLALIVNELLHNAVKHGGGAQVGLHMSGGEDGVTIRIRNASGGLPQGLDLASGRGLGTGLGLVKALLPRKGAELRLDCTDATVVAELVLHAPLIGRRQEGAAAASGFSLQ